MLKRVRLLFHFHSLLFQPQYIRYLSTSYHRALTIIALGITEVTRSAGNSEVSVTKLKDVAKFSATTFGKVIL